MATPRTDCKASRVTDQSLAQRRINTWQGADEGKAHNFGGRDSRDQAVRSPIGAWSLKCRNCRREIIVLPNQPALVGTALMGCRSEYP